MWYTSRKLLNSLHFCIKDVVKIAKTDTQEMHRKNAKFIADYFYQGNVFVTSITIHR